MPRLVFDFGKSGSRGRLEGADTTWEWPALPVGGAGTPDGPRLLVRGIVDGVTAGGVAPGTIVVGSNFIPEHGFPDAVRAGLADALPGVGVALVQDGILAHAGALGGPGVVASVGTGVVVFGVDGRGVRRVDGWGPDLGDRGGAVDLGRRGLAAVCAALDGVGPATDLTGVAERHLGRPVGPPAVRWLLARPDRVPLMAGFAREVVATASGGDGVARALVAGAASRVAASCAAAAGGADLPVVVVGRLGRSAGMAEALADALVAAGMRQVAPRGGPLDATWAMVTDEPYRGASSLLLPPGAVTTSSSPAGPPR